MYSRATAKSMVWMLSISRGSYAGDLGPSVTKMGGSVAIKTWSLVEGGEVSEGRCSLERTNIVSLSVGPSSGSEGANLTPEFLCLSISI